jgi:CBS domain-containing protein
MDDINESMARARGAKPAPVVRMPTARDCMTHRVITFTPEQPVHEVVKVLLAKGISGAPVVDATRKLVGMISELDCIRAIAADAYEERYGVLMDRMVRDEMSRDPITIEPNADIYKMAQLFETHGVRRLPVVEDGALSGQVSRRDVLREIAKNW